MGLPRSFQRFFPEISRVGDGYDRGRILDRAWAESGAVWIYLSLWTAGMIGFFVFQPHSGAWGLLLLVIVPTPLALGFSIYVVRRRIGRSIRKQLAERCIRICIECGYDLTGNVSGVCPECGAEAERVSNAETTVSENHNPPPR